MSIPKTLPNLKLAEFIRTTRARYGLTQDQMAARITDGGYEVSGETISRWEITGKIPPLREGSYARILARAYGTTPAQLLQLSGGLDFLPAEDLNAILKKLPVRLLNLLDDASPKQIELITRIVIAILAGDE